MNVAKIDIIPESCKFFKMFFCFEAYFLFFSLILASKTHDFVANLSHVVKAK